MRTRQKSDATMIENQHENRCQISRKNGSRWVSGAPKIDQKSLLGASRGSPKRPRTIRSDPGAARGRPRTSREHLRDPEGFVKLTRNPVSGNRRAVQTWIFVDVCAQGHLLCVFCDFSSFSCEKSMQKRRQKRSFYALRSMFCRT